jgi:hypothetical protein
VGIQPLPDHSHGTGAWRRLIAAVHGDFRWAFERRRVYGRVQIRCLHMSPTWIWMQVAIVVFVLIGMVVAITKLA